MFFISEPDATNSTISWKTLQKLLTALNPFHLAIAVQLLSNFAPVLIKSEIFLYNTFNR